jgi:hypothetical protein
MSSELFKCLVNDKRQNLFEISTMFLETNKIFNEKQSQNIKKKIMRDEIWKSWLKQFYKILSKFLKDSYTKFFNATKRSFYHREILKFFFPLNESFAFFFFHLNLLSSGILKQAVTSEDHKS